MAKPGMIVEVLEFELAKLKLSKGDTLVIKIPMRIMVKAKGHVGKIMKKAFPEINCLILPKEFDIEVVTQDTLAHGGGGV